MPVVAAVGVLAVVIIAGISGHNGSTSAGTVPATADPNGVAASTVPITTQPIVVNTDTAIVKTNLTHTIGKGNAGDDVKAVQQRLTDLGFAPGPVDGLFGSGTQQAVWAYEKLVLKTPRSQAKGRVTNEMWQVMQDQHHDPAAPTDRIGHHARRDLRARAGADRLQEQRARVDHAHLDGRTERRWHTEEVVRDADATTPTPTASRCRSPSPRTSAPTPRRRAACSASPVATKASASGPLGGMMNPVYFNYGIAVHGADNVPLEPASHGCVRLNQTIAKVFPSMVSKGDLVYVWGQDGKQPEQYSRADSLPSFNYANPDATTTTSSTTTTVPRTTVPAPTTTAKTATTPPATTTAPAVTTTTPNATSTTSQLFG